MSHTCSNGLTQTTQTSPQTSAQMNILRMVFLHADQRRPARTYNNHHPPTHIGI